jgi:uncharacterized protein DUF4412
MRKSILAFLCWSLVSTGALGATTPTDGSADYETTHDGKLVASGKLYARGTRFRSESESQGKRMSMIVDTGTKTMWMLMPPPVGCMEQKLKSDQDRGLFFASDAAAKEERVGAETIDGHPTEKYKVTTRVGDASSVNYVWRATDLSGFPIQTSDEAGSMKTRFKNVSLTKPDPKLFEPPTSCKAMPDFGAMQREMQQQMQKQMEKSLPQDAPGD